MTAQFDRAVAEFFMRLALEEAKLGLGRTHPNPTVGAVLVKSGRVVGRGFTAPYGGPHAEVVALQRAGLRARGADLYTTLEPCNHFGRTPPCTDAIIAAQVRRVFVASGDPNPLVDGKGIRRLKRSGIEVVQGVLSEEAGELNRPFFKFMRTGLPWVTLKVAVSLDGKLATRSGDSQWISSNQSRVIAHQLRNRVDAILVGANTVLKDDPRLNTRLKGGRDPLRIVLDPALRARPGSKIFGLKSNAKTVVATRAVNSAKARALKKRGVELWRWHGLEPLLRNLAHAGCLHLMVEGGAYTHSSFLNAGLFDEVVLVVAPKLLGHESLTWSGALGIKRVANAPTLVLKKVEQVGPDACLTLLRNSN